MASIGIIGSDSTHTENYAGILNGDVAQLGLRATRIWGADPAQTRTKAGQAGIPTVVDRLEDALQDVDAVMVLGRRGADHFEPAKLAVERGLPLFVDKPLTDDPAEAVALMRAAQARGVPLMSASAVRYDRRIVGLREELDGLGELRGLTFTLPNDWALYGVHAVDVMHAILGRGVADVTALRDARNDLVTLRWTDGRFGMVAQLRDSLRIMQAIGYASDGWAVGAATPDDEEGGFPRYYVDTMRTFHAMLASGTAPIDAAEMVDVVRVFAACDRSAREGRRVPLDEIEAL